MTPHAPLALALALVLAGCGFATEPDPGHADGLDAGAGGSGGGPGEADYGAAPDMLVPGPPNDAGIADAAFDAAPTPDADIEPDADLFDQGLFDGGTDGALDDLGPDDLGPDQAFDDLGPDQAFDDLGPDDLGPADLGPADLGPDAEPIGPLPDPRCVDACAALQDCQFPANPACVAECDAEPGPARVLLARCARDHAADRCDPLGFIECADRDPTLDDTCLYACDAHAACELEPGCFADCLDFAESYPPDCIEDHLDRGTCDIAAYDDCRLPPDP